MRPLVTGGERSSARIRRIPAHEIESVVVGAVVKLLGDHGRLLEALGSVGAADADRAARAATRLHGQIGKAAFHEQAAMVRPMLRRVVLGDGGVQISIGRKALGAALDLPVDAAEDARYEVAVPARVTTRGQRLKLVVGASDNPGAAPDPVLIKMIARAHEWWGKLEAGEVGSMEELAKAAEVSRPYVSRVLQLAFLAPDVVEAILKGEQPIELTAKGLLKMDLPLDWREQRRRLGFAVGGA